jgi:hypothetical protein
LYVQRGWQLSSNPRRLDQHQMRLYITISTHSKERFVNSDRVKEKVHLPVQPKVDSNSWMSARFSLRSSRVIPLASRSRKHLISILSHKRIYTGSYRWYTQDSSQPPKKQRSRHASWYSDILPNMIPIALLGFAVYGVRVTLLFESTLSA